MKNFVMGFVVLMVAGVAGAVDVLHLHSADPENPVPPIRCKIEAITDEILTYQTAVRLPNGQIGTAKRTISTRNVKFIDFGEIAGEAALLEKLEAAPETATIDEIDEVWEKKFAHLHRPKNNAAVFGLALGEALLRSDEDFRWDRALKLFDMIHEDAWDAESKSAARQGRLRTLIRQGNLETAIAEARQLAAETEDARMLIEARYIVAQADFEQLKKLEEENPKWAEDDTVLPERNRLYHSTVDQFLWPYLFHGTVEEQAARGLVAAGEVYRFAHKETEATACFSDVMKLYPKTEAAAKAATFLQTNETQPTNSDDSKNEKP